jgi:hypothetical protein
MKNIVCLFALLFGLSAGQTLTAAMGRPMCGMPEPSAIPELAVGVAGLGFIAWRRRKQSA